MVMVNHAAYPNTPGKKTPASASPYWITTVLRKRIGYRGIIFSDDLEMGGILKFISIEEAAITAFRAGMNMVEICHNPELILRAYEALLFEAERSAAFSRLLLERARRTSQQRAMLCVSGVPHALPTKQFEALRARILRFAGSSQGGAHRMSAKPMTVAGIMSGTSADGIDVTITRIAPGKQRPSVKLLAHEGFAFPASLRRAILAAMNARATSTAELARLNWRLGLAYAEAVTATLAQHDVKLDLIGCHGQTIYHQPSVESYAGRRFNCTWQLGEAALLASAINVPVVSNFRPADMLAGGQGAPLVPLLDYALFADAKRGRVLQNIGGIANLTAIPAGAARKR